jgi:UDP-N-acetylmuramyl pentapeptide synthase
MALVGNVVRPGDCVLVKGARAMGLERIADALTTVPA